MDTGKLTQEEREVGCAEGRMRGRVCKREREKDGVYRRERELEAAVYIYSFCLWFSSCEDHFILQTI